MAVFLSEHCFAIQDGGVVLSILIRLAVPTCGVDFLCKCFGVREKERKRKAESMGIEDYTGLGYSEEGGFGRKLCVW